MSTTLLPPQLADTRPVDGGVPARRAVVRWAWRLFRREWRQQFLILALIVVAVAATIVGSSVATNTPAPKNFGFGTAGDSATYSTLNAQVTSEITYLERRFGRVEVIENATMTIPGSINTFQLRAQDPHGPFSRPMLALVSGRYPTGADEVAVTSGVASAFLLKVGDTWQVGGTSRRVVGVVKNPQSLLSEFALVAPGLLQAPTQVVALFDAPGVPLGSIQAGTRVQTPASVARSNPFNP
jgi:putative ABC transport system permease protein